MKILHAFADTGVESEMLQQYGDVVRVGIDPERHGHSQVVQADACRVPFPADTFDLSVWHPPCGRFSPLSDTNGGDSSDWPNHIPDARREAQRVSEHYVIENKHTAVDELHQPTVLEGEMFGKPYEYKRAFETSFPVDSPPKIDRFGKTEMQPFYSSEHSRERWATAKGYPPTYPKSHLAKNCVPRAYLEHLLAAYFAAVDQANRPDYTAYDREKQTKERAAANQSLFTF